MKFEAHAPRDHDDWKLRQRRKVEPQDLSQASKTVLDERPDITIRRHVSKRIQIMKRSPVLRAERNGHALHGAEDNRDAYPVNARHTPTAACVERQLRFEPCVREMPLTQK
jgi:hypothetical protein